LVVLVGIFCWNRGSRYNSDKSESLELTPRGVCRHFECFWFCSIN